MPALFPRSANLVMGLALSALLLIALGIPISLLLYMHTPDAHAQLVPVDQPVEFDHRHHVRDDGIDCYYCHGTAENTPYAGVPATEVCMGCHNQVYNQSALLEPLRHSYFADEALAWNRVHRLPGHVYFNHAAHVQKGVGCVTCHGRVDLMPRVYKVAPITMGWCIECHRAPERHLRPRELITAMEWVAPAGGELGRRLAREYGVRSLTHCSTCHR